jgi:broad specificity phosphatase PhoE
MFTDSIKAGRYEVQSTCTIQALIPDKQAQALGKAFSGVKVDFIYASPLLRAHATGQAILDAQPSPQPPFIVNFNLREQYCGIAEGQPAVAKVPAGQTAEELIAKNIFPILYSRSAKFPEGESLDDVARRADIAIVECVLPHVLEDGAHIVIAGHGVCIGELIPALVRLDPDSRADVSCIMLNTAWTRVSVSVKVSIKLYVFEIKTLIYRVW